MLVSLLGILPAGDAVSADIEALLHDASRDGRYRQPDDRELKKAEELFVETLSGKPLAALRPGWNELHFDLEEVTERGSTMLLVKEQGGFRTGRGFYLIRRGGIPLLLQMPHSFKDENTRRIGYEMALEGKCTAAAWNTVPRWYDENGTRVDADLAHLGASYFTALTRAFLRVRPAGIVAQLHGFAPEKRKSVRAAQADVIISSGRRSVTQAVRDASGCLGKDPSFKVLVYPTDVRELGGTGNAIGRLMGESGNNGFVHLELSGDLRSKLINSAAKRSLLNQCLAGAIR
jgi:hypothetical protein